MQVTCSKSGEVYSIEYFSEIGSLVQDHPIFSLQTRSLVFLAKEWAAGKYGEKERKLFFLALLNKTENVLFSCPAFPSDKTVVSNIPNLLRLIQNSSEMLEGGNLFLPKYRISSENKDLSGIHNWINECFREREAWMSPLTKRQLSAKMQMNNLVLDRLLASPGKSPEQYAGKLLTYAEGAAPFPVAKRELWRSFFYLRGNEVYAARTEDLEELLDHLQTELYVLFAGAEHGFHYAQKVLDFIRDILGKNKRGMVGDIGGEDYYSILRSSELGDIEQHNIRLIAASAPASHPKPHDYSSTGLYLKALAAWRVAEGKEKVEDIKRASLERNNSVPSLTNFQSSSSS